MKLLQVTRDLLKLPVTDVGHVVHEINVHRKWQTAIQRERKRRSVYMQVYKYTRNNGTETERHL